MRTAPGQLDLFADAPAPPPPTGRWLTGIQEVAAAAVNVPTAAEAIRRMATVTSIGRDRRPRQHDAELAVTRALAARSAAISAEVCAELAGGVPGLGRVDAATWGPAPPATRGGRAHADATLTIACEQGDVVVPVNVKRIAGRPRGDNAVSERHAWNLVLGEEPGAEIDLPAARLEVRAGRRDLVPADYILLVIQGVDAELRWWTQGLVSGVRADGTLASVRHRQAERVRFWPAASVVPDELDVAAALCDAWAPEPSISHLREQILLLARDAGADPGQLRNLAGVLLDLGDDALVLAVLRAIAAAKGNTP